MVIGRDQIFGQGLSLVGDPRPNQLGNALYYQDSFREEKVEINIYEASFGGWVRFSLWTSDRTIQDDNGDSLKLIEPILLLESGYCRFSSSSTNLVFHLPGGALVEYKKYIAVYRQKSDEEVTGKVTALIP